MDARSDPEWLVMAREMAAIAQSGLAFTRDPYDRERYQALTRLAARAMARHGGGGGDVLERMFLAQEGYATPKIDVRGAVFREGRLLMVREVADEGRWTLPGGWADVNLTPAENVVREVREESGFRVRPRKLAAVWDRTRQGHVPKPFSAAKLFFLCEIEGGAAATSAETSEVAFFAEAEIPAFLSHDRILPRQIARMFAHWRDPALPTEFD